MKKGILFTSLALLLSVVFTGCSCSKDGAYNFSHIEYAENGENKETDCSNPTGEREAEVCSLVSAIRFNELTINLEDKNISLILGDEAAEEGFYKIKDGKVLISETEDGEYVNIFEDFNMDIRYDDKAIRIHQDFFTIVYKR